MSFLKEDNPHNPKKDKDWADDFMMPVLERSEKMARQLKLPAVTREMSLFAMMQECPAIVDKLEGLGIKGKKLYQQLYAQYWLYERNGFNRNHIPEDMEDRLPPVVAANNNPEDGKVVSDVDRPVQQNNRDADKNNEDMFIDTDVTVGIIMIEMGNEIAEAKALYPSQVMPEVYDYAAFECFLRAAFHATFYPGQYFLTYSPTPIMISFLYQPDPKDEMGYILRPPLMDELTSGPKELRDEMPADITAKLEENAKDAVETKGKNPKQVQKNKLPPMEGGKLADKSGGSSPIQPG